MAEGQYARKPAATETKCVGKLDTMTAVEYCPSDPRTNMSNTLRTPQVRTILDRLFAAAAQDDEMPRCRQPNLSWEIATAQERADASEFTYMPI